jgi:hypothetical protein
VRLGKRLGDDSVFLVVDRPLGDVRVLGADASIVIPIHALSARFQHAADDVAGAPDLIDGVVGLQGLENGLQRWIVAVDVGDESDSHQRDLVTLAMVLQSIQNEPKQQRDTDPEHDEQ